VLLNVELNVDHIDNNNQLAITQKLTGMDGVEDVNIDLQSKIVTAKYDDGKARLIDIKQSMMEEGYSVMAI
jgi:copper chaperone CopZ